MAAILAVRAWTVKAAHPSFIRATLRDLRAIQRSRLKLVRGDSSHSAPRRSTVVAR